MSTSLFTSMPDFGLPTQMLTAIDLANSLGDIPLGRICFSPLPGTATRDDLLRLNDVEGRHYELIHGTLVEKAMGSFEGVLANWIATHFYNYLDVHELGAAFGDNTPLVFSPRLVYIPDCGFISSARMPGGEFPSDKPLAEMVPNLAVEVISISNTAKEMERKLTSYFECGVEEVWYVYPVSLQVHQMRPQEKPIIRGIEETIATHLLPGFALSVRKLFSPPGRRLK